MLKPPPAAVEPARGAATNRRRERRGGERPARPRSTPAVPAMRGPSTERLDVDELEAEAEPLAAEAEREESSTGAVNVEEDEPIVERPPTPSEARLGPEGVSRLRGRFAELLARISDSGEDEATQVRLKERAERLNPDAWVTDAEVDEGLEQYEAIFAELRAVVGHGRRRRPQPPDAP